jgi:hypothetical protein
MSQHGMPQHMYYHHPPPHHSVVPIHMVGQPYMINPHSMYGGVQQYGTPQFQYHHMQQQQQQQQLHQPQQLHQQYQQYQHQHQHQQTQHQHLTRGSSVQNQPLHGETESAAIDSGNDTRLEIIDSSASASPRPRSAPLPKSGSDSTKINANCDGKSDGEEEGSNKTNENNKEKLKIAKSPRGNKHAFQPLGGGNNRSQKKRKAGTPVVDDL